MIQSNIQQQQYEQRISVEQTKGELLQRQLDVLRQSFESQIDNFNKIKVDEIRQIEEDLKLQKTSILQKHDEIVKDMQDRIDKLLGKIEEEREEQRYKSRSNTPSKRSRADLIADQGNLNPSLLMSSKLAILPFLQIKQDSRYRPTESTSVMDNNQKVTVVSKTAKQVQDEIDLEILKLKDHYQQRMKRTESDVREEFSNKQRQMEDTQENMIREYTKQLKEQFQKSEKLKDQLNQQIDQNTTLKNDIDQRDYHIQQLIGGSNQLQQQLTLASDRVSRLTSEVEDKDIETRLALSDLQNKINNQTNTQ